MDLLTQLDVKPVSTNTEAPIRTLNINLHAAPGVGKSATANRLTSLLKLRNINAELVPEYSKELHWDGRLDKTEQFIITAEQWRRQALLQGKIQVVVADSAVALGSVYAPDAYKEPLKLIIQELTKDWWSLDIMLERKSGLTPEQFQIQKNILDMTRLSGKNYYVDTVDETVSARLADKIVKMLDKHKSQ